MSEILKDFFQSQKRPLILRNQLKDWKILKYNLEKWTSVFGERKLPFRQGEKISSRNTPQWESRCETVHLTMGEFLEQSSNTDEWLYFDYKAMSEVFHETEILEGVKWSNFGHQDRTGSDSTFWMGSKGAHTPCHMDTYGYNLVAQVYGRKLWLLAPPTETNNRHATRVPYEESSVYSEINFYAPQKKLVSLEKVHRVVLEPGEVLLVPRHWWHYVENLELAISVNIWIPMVEDDISRLEEALVQRFIWSTIQDLPENEAKEILNPNHYELLDTEPQEAVLVEVARKAISRLSLQDNKSTKETLKIGEAPPKKKKLSDKNLQEELAIPASLKPYLVFLQPMSQQELTTYSEEKINKLQCNKETLTCTNQSITHMIINSFCHPDTVQVAKDKFIQQMLLTRK